MEQRSNHLNNLNIPFEHPDRFGHWLGYQLKSIDITTHEAELTLDIRPDHLSPAGRVHGGVISAFFDQAFGACVVSTLEKGQSTSTVELKINYLVPLELGDQLLIKAKSVFRGKRLCVLQGFLYKNGKAQPAAMATATFNIIMLKK